MPPPPARARSHPLPTLVLLAVALAVAGAGALAYRAGRAGARARAAAELEAVVALKADLVESWRNARERDAFFAGQFPFVARVLASPRRVDPELRVHGASVLQQVVRQGGLDLAAVVRLDGAPMVTYARPGAPDLPLDAALTARAMEGPAWAATALYARPEEAVPRMEVVAPVRGAAGEPIGAVYARAPLGTLVAQLTGAWPGPSRTARVEVLRIVDGQVQRVEPDLGRPGSLAAPGEGPGLGARWRSAAGPEGTFVARAEDGALIMATTRAIPGSDWRITARMDLDEVEAPVRRDAALIGGVLTLFLAGCAVWLLVWSRRQDVERRALQEAQERLAESEERIKLALAGSGHYVWTWDLVAGRLEIDPTWAALQGLPSASLEGSDAAVLGQLVHGEDLADVLATWRRHASGEEALFEAQHRMRQAPARWALKRGQVDRRDASGRPLHAAGVVSDVTALQEMRAELDRAQRLAGLGTLAAGMAHEVNNPLSYVLSSIEHLTEELKTAAPDRLDLIQAVWDARDGAERVRDVVRSLRAFSRPGPPQRGRVDVRAEVEAAVRLAASEVRHRARLELRLEPMPAVLASVHELGQVFLNLLVNAGQAIPEGHPGALVTVCTGTDPSGWAQVEVHDNGEGIPPEVLPRIFEPFFTTKAPGAGTGLGLALAHRIVSTAGGRIEVESEPGRGTTFRVLLPPAPAGPAEPPPPAAPALAPPAAGGLGQRVLVVDDDPLVARSVARSLGPAHRVTVVSSGEEALALLLGGAEFDVVLCDLMMPGMTGMELHERVTAQAPTLARRFVFMTGGAFTEGARSFLDQQPEPAIEKPFEAAALRAAVERVGRAQA